MAALPGPGQAVACRSGAPEGRTGLDKGLARPGLGLQGRGARCGEEPLVFRLWKPGDQLVPGVWDIPIPTESATDVLPDVLLVPMLAFDRAGYRLGYGGGFYDRTLEKLRKLKRVAAIGVAYQAQMVDQVPIGPYDAPLDFVMTEQETFSCG